MKTTSTSSTLRYVDPQTVADHISAHYKLFAAGKTFDRYEICPARLLPCGKEEGEPSVFEKEGFWYIGGGEGEIARRIAQGEKLISCKRAEECDTSLCTPERVRAWEEKTGVKLAKTPFSR